MPRLSWYNRSKLCARNAGDTEIWRCYIESQKEKRHKAFGEYEYLTLNDKMCNSHIDSCLLTVFLIAKDFDGKAMIGTMMT